MVNFKPNKTMQQRQSVHYKHFQREKKSGEGKDTKKGQVEERDGEGDEGLEQRGPGAAN